jgi:hypothetical protein
MLDEKHPVRLFLMKYGELMMFI